MGGGVGYKVGHHVIYLITGVPGSGKSLYAVSTLIQSLAGQSIKNKDGTISNRRLLVDGVKRLLVNHEMMAPGVENVDGTMEPGEGHGLWNWYEWCKPGDVLFVDEIQRWWRPRGNGVKPPLPIQRLETHRHKGVDFVIVTQGPMLLDMNVRKLVGSHTHVRRVLGTARAILYSWDSCSNEPTKPRGAVAKLWNYPKKGYQLYASAELHTKQKHSIPWWVVVPVVAMIGGVFVLPKAFAILSSAGTGKGVGSSSVADQIKSITEKTNGKTAAAPSAVMSAPAAGASLPQFAQQQHSPLVLGGASAPPAVVNKFGCVAFADKCKCLEANGSPLVMPLDLCREVAGHGKPAMQLPGPDTPISVAARVAFEAQQASGPKPTITLINNGNLATRPQSGPEAPRVPPK